MENENPIDIQDWNVREGAPDLAITTLHGETAHDGLLFQLIPDLKSRLHEADQAVFPDFLDLEADVFSTELAQEIIRQILERYPQLFIRWVNSRVHRAILDANREEADHAVRRLWAPEHQPLMTQTFLPVHSRGRQERMNAIQRAAFTMDLHTMYPYDPIRPTGTSNLVFNTEPGQLADYNHSFVSARWSNGKRRAVNLFHADEKGRAVSDREWLNMILSGFIRNSIPANVDVTFKFGSVQTATQSVLEAAQVAGLALDIPKDLFVGELPKDGIYRPSQLDSDQLEELAGILARGFCRRLKLAIEQGRLAALA